MQTNLPSASTPAFKGKVICGSIINSACFFCCYHKFSKTIRGHGSELAFINVIAVIGDSDRIVSGNGDERLW